MLVSYTNSYFILYIMEKFAIGTKHSATISMKYLKRIQGISIMITFSAEPCVSFCHDIYYKSYIFWVMFTSSGAPLGPLYKLC